MAKRPTMTLITPMITPMNMIIMATAIATPMITGKKK